MDPGDAADAGSRPSRWSALRVERCDWRTGARELTDCATYRVTGGQREAFEALRAFSDEHLEPVVVDLGGLGDGMKDQFLEFLASTGLEVVEWVSPDAVVLTASGRGGGAGVREPREPRIPTRQGELPTPSER